jgi:hypothetical protein
LSSNKVWFAENNRPIDLTEAMPKTHTQQPSGAPDAHG